jgi:hypothetical protein
MLVKGKDDKEAAGPREGGPARHQSRLPGSASMRSRFRINRVEIFRHAGSRRRERETFIVHYDYTRPDTCMCDADDNWHVL